MPEGQRSFATRAVHAGGDIVVGKNPPLGGLIATSSVYAVEDLEAVDRCYAGDPDAGHFYQTFGNPNEQALAAAVADLEGAEAGFAASTGMGALSALILSKVRAGDEIVAAREIYGGTRALLKSEVTRLGLTVRFVDASDPASVATTVTAKTRMILLETISNPLLRVLPLREIVERLPGRRAEIVVDNTFATPYLFRPLEQGADVVVHSATKYLGGHDDLAAGVAAGSAERMKEAKSTLIRIGTAASPFECWLTLRGIKTLHLRMERIVENAGKIAAFLEDHARVLQVFYPGLHSSGERKHAGTDPKAGAGGLVSFEIDGGAPAVSAFFHALTLIRFAPSLGGVGTTVSYPAKTSHRALSAEERQDLGISDGLVRLSVGTEDVEDIRADLERGLAA